MAEFTDVNGVVTIRDKTGKPRLIVAADGSLRTRDSNNDADGSIGGATPSLSSVLTSGASAGNLAITNLADPSNAQDAATRAYVLANGGALPSGWHDVTNLSSLGLTSLVDDGVTDNTAALQALINSIPTSGDGRFSTFIFPTKTSGKYGFGSTVDFTNKPIQCVGVGSGTYNDGRYQTTIWPLANSMQIFKCDGNGSLFQVGPRFQQLHFAANSKTGCTGLYVHQHNRVHLRDCQFDQLATGVELYADGQDCAYHEWFNLTFYGCTTGVYSHSSNHWSAYGMSFLNCATGLYLAATTSQVKIYGFECGLSANQIGAQIEGYANQILGAGVEMNANTNGCKGIFVTTTSSGASSTKGSGNKIDATLSGGSGASTTNLGVHLDTYTTNNVVNTSWATGFSASGGSIKDDATNGGNRINSGAVVSTAATRPTAGIQYKGVTHLASDTDAVTICDGTAWFSAGGGTSGSISVSENDVGADVTMTTAGTYYDGPTLTLNAGSYLLIGSVQLLGSTSAARRFDVKLWDGTTVTRNSSMEITGTAAAGQSLVPVMGVVNPGSSTTYKISATSTVNGDTLQKNTAASYLIAIQYSNITTSENDVSGDVTMTTNGTYYDGPSLSLNGGSYLLFGAVQLLASTSAVRRFDAKLWDGTNTVHFGSSEITGTSAAGQVLIPFFGSVTPSTTTTYKISARSTVDGDTLQQNTSASYLIAVKVA